MVHTGLIQTTEEINGQAYSKCRTVPININLISSHSLLKMTDLEFERTIKLTNQQFCGNMIMIIHCIIYHDTGYINLGFVFWQPSNQFRSQTVGSDAQNRQLHGNHGNRQTRMCRKSWRRLWCHNFFRVASRCCQFYHFHSFSLEEEPRILLEVS